MIRRNAFIYPSTGMSATVSNPYIDDFIAGLTENFNFLNKSRRSRAGILNLYSYVGKIDIVFFNWIEDLPDKRGGIPQTILFAILLFILKTKKIRIVYTLHNKESHYSTNRKLKTWLRRLILNQSDYILCHSSEGLKILDDINIRQKAKYLPHPFRPIVLPASLTDKKYDILIWGAVRKYKGIDTYLKYLESRKIINKYKTLIVGKIVTREYEDELNEFKSDSVQIVNKFIENEELNDLIDHSRITLFIYREKGLLSSGALVYSLSRGAHVIGPNAGAFKDLQQEGLIDVFDDYDDLVEKIDFHLNNPCNKLEKLNDFINKNSWNAFGVKISDWIGGTEQLNFNH